MKSKKIFVLLSALALLLGACNAGKGESKSQQGNSNSQSNTSETSQGGGQEDDVPVTAITLNKNELSLEATKSETLTWTVAPDNASDTSVTFESDHPEFATVSNMGKITGVAVGNATITVKSVSNPEVTATCAVTVTEEGGKYGSVNKPKSVEQALAIAAEECKESNAYTAEDVYVTGYVCKVPTYKEGFTQNIYIKDSLTDANAKEFLIYSADHESTLTPYQNDKIIVHGKIQNYNGRTIEMTSKDKVNPAIDKVERGTSSIKYVVDDGQVNSDAPTSAKNLAEVSFTVTPVSGKAVSSVVANGEVITAQQDGSYKMRVKGDMVVVINIFEPGAVINMATMKYSGATDNMTEGNNAGKVNLDAALFTVTSTNQTGNYAGLNTAGNIRLYNNYKSATAKTDGTEVLISSKRAEMKKIVITLAASTVAGFDKLQIKAGDAVVAAGANPGVYTFNGAGSVLLKNVSDSDASDQIHITSVDIYYSLKEVVEATAIAVSPKTASVETDKTVKLTATLTPSNANQPVLWKTSDETKATVADGTVTGVAVGSATITAFVDANGNGQLDTDEKKDEAQITVTQGETVNYGTAEAPLTIAQAKAVLDLTGSSESKKPLYVKGIVYSNTAFSSYGNYDAVWLQSDDGTVAEAFELYRVKLDSAVTGDFTAADSLVGYEVVATGLGKVFGSTYELTSSSNEPKNPSILSATDKKSTLTITGISISKTTLEVEVGSDADLVANSIPAAAKPAISWKSSDETKAAVTSGKVTGVGVGDATITAYIDANNNKALDEGEFKAECAVTVKEQSGTKTVVDLSKNNTTTATESQISWVIEGVASIVNTQGSGGTAANNYYGGDSNNRTSTRFYGKSTLTITPASGKTIAKIEFIATSEGYASALGNSTWTNAKAAVSEKNVTITPTNGTIAISAAIGATCGFTAINLYTK